MCVVLLSACQPDSHQAVDRLNTLSYAWHYRDLDSTAVYARRALELSAGYGSGRAEAYNHLAFVYMAKMRYKKAEELLHYILRTTNNEVELLVADVQLMRLCQRQSRNKDFYEYMARARHRLSRIKEERHSLDRHGRHRFVYASTELEITASTYYYYLGLTQQSVAAIDSINPGGAIMRDTAQLCNYFYAIGSGGILSRPTEAEVAQEEFDYLSRCYFLAIQGHYPYWEAQALQAMSEHLQVSRKQREQLLRDNSLYLRYINIDEMPDSLLAGNLAQRGLDLFRAYGDVYQIAGGYRTLAKCYWSIGDYTSALGCLHRALTANTAIKQAPDLVASIREQLCLVYSAMDDKPASDYNRNMYLDIQEQTRQDRYYEARAAQLARSSRQLNILLAAVVLMIIVVILLLFFFDRMRRRSDARFSLDTLLGPLRQWEQQQTQQQQQAQEHYEEVEEQQQVGQLHLQQNLRRNLEQRAKVSLVCSILPLIDRIVNELRQLRTRNEKVALRQQRLQYISELTDTIARDNDILTRWIQMRQGQVSLKIETFPLQDLFDVAQQGSMSFRICGLNLDVKPTQAIVKADKALTFFMISTITANARRFTPQGGSVTIEAFEQPDSVEISIRDTGCGMSDEQLTHLFDRTYTGGHGFGLKNCNGIIESYRKLSSFFSVCSIGAESKIGKGSRIFFRLPKGMARLIVLMLTVVTTLFTLPLTAVAESSDTIVVTRDNRAARFADSAYYSNLAGTYQRTLDYADSCQRYLVPTDTASLLTVSNEAAVAALALHKWSLYHHYNTIYTHLFRQASADSMLPDYVQRMQRSQNNKNVAGILLLLLLVVLPPAYYLLYYRHLLNYRYSIDRINTINRLLMGKLSDEEKLNGIKQLAVMHTFQLPVSQQHSLDSIVQAICEALQKNIDRTALIRDHLGQAEDELRRIRREADSFHVANSVLDNCLSTIKHETLYYPSRIRQLVTEAADEVSGNKTQSDEDPSSQNSDTVMESLWELTNYYRTLYGILTGQLLDQLAPLSFKSGLVEELFDQLRMLNGRQSPQLSDERQMGGYVILRVEMTMLHLTPRQCHELFTPLTVDTGFLVCRQILREMGETTHLRGCGIEALVPDNEELTRSAQVILRVVLPVRLYHRGENSSSLM